MNARISSHTAFPRMLLLGGALLGACLLTACGDSAPAAPTPAAPVWMVAKPNPFLESLKAAVVERPAPDRARIEAHWRNEQLWPGCVVELVLPEGVIAVEGETRHAPQVDEPSGMASWLVEFPSGRPLDAVVRYCIETPEGVRSAQVAVRLTD